MALRRKEGDARLGKVPVESSGCIRPPLQESCGRSVQRLALQSSKLTVRVRVPMSAPNLPAQRNRFGPSKRGEHALVAQSARASACQVEGRGFESPLTLQSPERPLPLAGEVAWADRTSGISGLTGVGVTLGRDPGQAGLAQWSEPGCYIPWAGGSTPSPGTISSVGSTPTPGPSGPGRCYGSTLTPLLSGAASVS